MARPVQAWSPFPLPKRAYPGAGRGRGGMNPVRLRSAPPDLFDTISPQLGIEGAQAQGVIGANGTATLSAGPTGLGTVWYPASAVVSTSLGVVDPSTATIYVGPSGQPTLQQGSIFTGNGVLALALPSMSPGLSIIAKWTGGTPGTPVYMNVTGTMTALMRSS
jgi:hypothetical protein